jgi:hypothetical protein
MVHNPLSPQTKKPHFDGAFLLIIKVFKNEVFEKRGAFGGI